MSGYLVMGIQGNLFSSLNPPVDSRRSISHRLAPVSRPLLKLLQISQNTICSENPHESP